MPNQLTMKRCRHKWSQEVALIGITWFSCDRCGRTKTVSAAMPTTYGPPLPEWRARRAGCCATSDGAR